MVHLSSEGGLRVFHRGFSLSFDSPPSKHGRSIGCVSHAHSDHVVTEGRVLATRETIALMRNVWGASAAFQEINYGESMDVFDDLKIKVHNSGHVLGASMFELTLDGDKLVYTGDINTVETLTTRPADYVDADTLILESTYGHPDYVFPSRDTVAAKILKWVFGTIAEGAIPAFKAYSIGKSQELIKLFNEYTKLPVVVGRTVAVASQTHINNGIKLNYIPTGTADAAATLLSGEVVYIDSQQRKVATHRKVKWATVTGWALKSVIPGFDAAFPLSSHADFPNLLNYVEEIKPRKIYVTHGFTHCFSNYLRRKGFDAQPIE